MKPTIALRAARATVSAVVALTLVAAAVLVSAPAASADSILLCTGYDACADLGMSDHGYAEKSSTSYWRMYGGHNCTNYAAYLMVKAGRSNTRPWSGDGNAKGWGTGNSKKTDTTPAVGSIAWWDTGAAGHVAYVEAVISPSRIIVSEDAWGGDFRWRVISKANAGWPKGFIHFRDANDDGNVPLWQVKRTSTAVYTNSTRQVAATPATMKPGTTAWVELAYQNTGTRTWSGVSLGTVAGADSALATAAWTAPNRATRQRESSVAPGETATFGFPIQIPATAPDQSTIVESFTPVYGAAVVKFGATKLTFGVDTRNPLTAKPIPTVAGTFLQGETLTVTPGTWKPATVQLSYRWKRDGAAIDGAIGKSYTLTAEDVGRSITVSVGGKKAGYLPALRTSVAAAAVRSTLPNKLSTGDKLLGGKHLISFNGRYRLVQQSSGALYVQDRFTAKKLWSVGKKGSHTELRANGSLVTYDAKGGVVWSSHTSGDGATRATVTSGGRLTLYTGAGNVVWTSAK